MIKLEITEEHANLIQMALDFYIRMSIGQWGTIVELETWRTYIENKFTDKVVEVGKRTPQGEILEIKDGKALISGSIKDNKWSEEHEWKKVEDVILSPDYYKMHEFTDNIISLINKAKYALTNMGPNASFGIHNDNVSNKCLQIYDIIQVMRHEQWKINPLKDKYMSVDARPPLMTGTLPLIKCQIEK